MSLILLCMIHLGTTTTTKSFIKSFTKMLLFSQTFLLMQTRPFGTGKKKFSQTNQMLMDTFLLYSQPYIHFLVN